MVVYPIGSLAKSSVSTESKKSLGSILGLKRRRKKAQILRPGKSKALSRPELGVGCRRVLRRPAHHKTCLRRLGKIYSAHVPSRGPSARTATFLAPRTRHRRARRRRKQAAGGGDGVQTLPAQGRERGGR